MITDHFSEREMKCPCCGKIDMDMEFMSKLEKARILADVPFIVNSAYRCKSHNKEVGGKVNSAHTKGLACDIKIKNSVLRYRILRALFDAQFFRIGIYEHFIHVDNDKSKPQEVCWYVSKNYTVLPTSRG